MSGSIDRENSILGNGIIESLDSGHVEIFSDTSGISLSSASGNISFKDENLSSYINFSESGESSLQNVNSKNSVIGVLNQVGLFYISSNDTIADYAENKIVSISGITVDVLNDGGNEQLQISVNPSALADVIEGDIEHNALDGLQGGVAGQYYHLTSQQFIDLTSGISADNQHFHNASAIVVDDTNFDVISGIDSQTVFDSIDNFLSDLTLLVNFDLGGGVLNGNARLRIDNLVPNIAFRSNVVGQAGFQVQVPDSYQGGDLSFKACWYSEGNNANNVLYRLTYKSVAQGEDILTATSFDVDQTVAEPGDDGVLVETTFTISDANVEVGDVLTLLFQRIGNDASDTSSDDSHIVKVSLDY